MNENDIIVSTECEKYRERIDGSIRRIHEKLDKYAEKQAEHGQVLTKNTTDIDHIARGLSNLTKALWGLASATIISVIGTVITLLAS